MDEVQGSRRGAPPLKCGVERMRNVALISTAFVFAAVPCWSDESASVEMPASVEMDEALAVYGPGIFQAVTKMDVCGPFRVMVVYWAGTDMLFVDEMELYSNESTMAVKHGLSIREFNYYEDSNSITKLSCKLSLKGGLEIAGKADSGHTNDEYSFRVVVDTAAWSYQYSDSQRKVD